MRFTSLAVAALAPLVPSVLGHGQVRKVITSSGTYTAADAYAAADPNSPIRKLNTYGPAAAFTGPDITCGPGGNVPVPNVAEVQAGSQVTFDWGSWSSSHSGPVMTYVARCPNGCANFKGDSGNVWVKIQHDGYNPTRTPPWGEEVIRSTGKYTVTIPSSLANGEWLLRHEILGLHVAGTEWGAQFYPNCIQIKIVGGGSANPTGIALPGAYQPQDSGILVELWRITPANPTYNIPGGPVILSGDGGSNPTVGPTSSTRASSTAPPTSSSRTSSATTPTSSSGGGTGAPLYGQCGGVNWTGPTTCAQGTCKKSNDYYSQCLP